MRYSNDFKSIPFSSPDDTASPLREGEEEASNFLVTLTNFEVIGKSFIIPLLEAACGLQINTQNTPNRTKKTLFLTCLATANHWFRVRE
jgi:hypothetical protein